MLGGDRYDLARNEIRAWKTDGAKVDDLFDLLKAVRGHVNGEVLDPALFELLQREVTQVTGLSRRAMALRPIIRVG
jgi:hypothetical protein